MNKYGVRIYPLDNNVILIKQTVKRTGSTGTYVIDMTEEGEHKEAHVDIDDNQEIADAIRAAIKGNLKRSIRDI